LHAAGRLCCATSRGRGRRGKYICIYWVAHKLPPFCPSIPSLFRETPHLLSMCFSRLPSLPSDGWRKTAVINTSIVGFLTLANWCILIWSLARSGVSEPNEFTKDDCDKISVLNTCLHLLLNIAFSPVIASSNFFMQALNSPTQAEVDQAHVRGRWLEIGVPSLRNVVSVSPYKSLAWALFSLSSVPSLRLMTPTPDYNLLADSKTAPSPKTMMHSIGSDCLGAESVGVLCACPMISTHSFESRKME
jgi:hypothetical protein